MDYDATDIPAGYDKTRGLLQERLPSRREIARTFEAAGLERVAANVVVQQVAPTYQAYDDKLAAGADSILASVTSDVLQKGLEEIRRDGRRVDPVPVTEPIDVLVFRATHFDV